MSADMGFANLFSKIGLINTGNSLFSAISTTSGGSWFSTQFFFSPEFHDNVAGVTPEKLRIFVLDWMNAYLDWAKTIPPDTTHCNFSSATTVMGEFQDQVESQLCNVLLHIHGNWAQFITDMLNATSNHYKDPSFIDRIAVGRNRVPSLNQTDLLIQTTLVPSARTSAVLGTLVLVGPQDTPNSVYSTLLPARYTIDDTSAAFTLGSATPLQVYTHKFAPSTFSYSDWQEYFLYPNRSNGTILISPPPFSAKSPIPLSDPFNSSDVVTAQLAAISSAAVGVFSSFAPSVLAQTTSLLFKENETDANLLYDVDKLGLLDAALSVCAQWPNSCGSSDSRFIDGGFSDDPALAYNIANYQQKHDDWNSTTLKIVVTNTNYANMKQSIPVILGYFNTMFNQDVQPGEFIWAAEEVAPWPSPQVFENYLDDSILSNISNPVNGTNMTTMHFTGLQTVDNPMYGVKGGQQVEMLWININSDVSTLIVGPDLIELKSPEVAELAFNVASNGIISERVFDFFFPSQSSDSPNESPTMTPAPSPTMVPTTCTPFVVKTSSPTSKLSIAPTPKRCVAAKLPCTKSSKCCNSKFVCTGKKKNSMTCKKCGKVNDMCTKAKDCCKAGTKEKCDKKKKKCLKCSKKGSKCKRNKTCCSNKCKKEKCK